MPSRGGICIICDKLKPEELIELDALIGDPGNWPRNAFLPVQLPKGPLPRSYAKWGAERLGVIWLAEHGYTISHDSVGRHWRFDVAKVPTSALAIAEDGADGALITPLNFTSYMQKGLEVGERALTMLGDYLMMAAEIDPELLLKVANLGAKIAGAQLTLAARGYQQTEDDTNEGFRRGAAPEASPRMGHSRVRVIEGEHRPVHDEGPADRAHYNERARQEAGPLLPAP